MIETYKTTNAEDKLKGRFYSYNSADKNIESYKKSFSVLENLTKLKKGITKPHLALQRNQVLVKFSKSKLIEQFY